jgi:hypothetical protein
MFHAVSAAYICKAYGDPTTTDDAKECFVYTLDDVPMEKLLFDHEKIVKNFIGSFGLEDEDGLASCYGSQHDLLRFILDLFQMFS